MTERSTKEMSEEQAELIDKWIYVLLAANDFEPIRGRVRFTKEYFIMAIEYLPEVFEAAQFYPYYFGPYSTRLGVRMNALKSENEIIAEYKSKDWQYSLSKSGQEKSKKILTTVEKDLIKKISNIKSRNRRLSLKALLKDIYLYYRDFASRSIIASDIVYDKIDPKELIVVDESNLVVSDTTKEKIVLKGKSAEKFQELIGS